MQLYEVADEVRELQQAYLDAETQEELDAIVAKLITVSDNLEIRVEQLCRIKKNIDADAKALQEEEDRLKERRKATENRAEHLKQMIANSLELAGMDKLKCGIFNVAFQRNSQPSVTCDVPEAELPDALRKVTVTYSLDREEILRRSKAGEELPPTIHVITGRHLRIR